jgi:guanylate kinase
MREKPDLQAGGVLYIISAASGTGKTSLVRALTEAEEGIVISVSHTTRPPRPGEQQGVHYHFVDASRFQAMCTAGAFLEYAQVFEHYYGTSRDWVTSVLCQGQDVILEIDWQGARQVRAAIPSVGIFILPPSREALEERLRKRGQDSDEVIARRLGGAIEEMSHYSEYDYLIINDDFERALGDLRCILRGQRLHQSRQSVREQARITSLLV